ncbi:MAG: hypothetical protein QGH37_31585 [Candidatus Poribacteria bacterium]|nr:hypothetical protein [Candidatus Poribacteria bacterium]MDP6996721.1 hypothetical protein [Candidatus Poribacteria bacterium]
MDYDAIGRWRTHEQISEGLGENPAVDASGKLADGRAFSGPDESKHLMARRSGCICPNLFGTQAFLEQPPMSYDAP